MLVVAVECRQAGYGGDATNLLLGQVIREVSNHDLGLGRDTVGRGAALPTLPGTSLGLAGLALLVAGRLVGDVLQSLGLVDGRILSGSGALLLLLVLVVMSVRVFQAWDLEVDSNREKTYTAVTATTSTAATATAGATATTGRVAAASTLSTTLDGGTLGLLVRLGLASELDGDLALKDLLARELGNGTVGLGGSREVDKGVADRAVGARVLRDRNGLTGERGEWLATIRGKAAARQKGVLVGGVGGDGVAGALRALVHCLLSVAKQQQS